MSRSLRATSPAYAPLWRRLHGVCPRSSPEAASVSRVCRSLRLAWLVCLQAVRTRRRTKDLDQVQDEIRKQDEQGGPKPRPRDDDLPGYAAWAGGGVCACVVRALSTQHGHRLLLTPAACEPVLCVAAPSQAGPVLLHRVRPLLHFAERQGEALGHQAAQAQVRGRDPCSVQRPLRTVPMQRLTCTRWCCGTRHLGTACDCARLRAPRRRRWTRLKHTREPQYTHKEAAAGAGQGSTATHVLEHVRTKRVGGGVSAGAGGAGAGANGGVAYGGRRARPSQVVDPATIPVVTKDGAPAVGNAGDIVM